MINEYIVSDYFPAIVCKVKQFIQYFKLRRKSITLADIKQPKILFPVPKYTWTDLIACNHTKKC